MERASTIAAALGLTLGLWGCQAATNAANGAGAYVEQTAEKLEQKTSDASITLAVKGALVDADDRLGRDVKASTVNGVVSLWGAVPTPAAKARAEEITRTVKGVVGVVNGIDVTPR